MEQHFSFTLLLPFVSSIILFIFFIVYKHRSQYKHPNLPPGSLGLPFFGESLDFLATGRKGHFEKFFSDRKAKYASEIFKTNLFLQPTVVLCSAAGNKFLFSNEDKLVKGWYPEFINKIFPSAMQTSPTKLAMRARKLLAEFLKPEALQRYIATMDTITQRHFASHWENQKEVVVFPLAKKHTFELACRLFLSVEDSELIAKVTSPFHELVLGLYTMPIDLPGTPFNRAIRAAKFIRTNILAIIKQRKKDLAEGKASPTQDVLSHLLSSCDENGQFLNENEIADYILIILIAGFEATGSACTFVVKCLAELPHIYVGVYKEQMEIAESKSPDDKTLNWNDLQKMKYSWNVVCEILRVHPILAGNFREAIHDINFNGFYIPKGWKLYWTSNSTHKSSLYFSEPEKFDPTRFEGEGPPPYAYVPFGGGPRMCPGNEYARVQTLIFMHYLVKKFKFDKLIPDEKITFKYPMPIPEKGLPIRLHPYKA